MRSAVLALLLSLAVVGSSATATLHVPSEYPTIQTAVEAASPYGDSILVAPGEYPEDVTVVEKTIHIVGSLGASATTVSSLTWVDVDPGSDPTGGTIAGFEVGGALAAGNLAGGLRINHCHVLGETNVDSSDDTNSFFASDSSVFVGPVLISGSWTWDIFHNDVEISDCLFEDEVRVTGGFNFSSITRCLIEGSGTVRISGRERMAFTDNAMTGKAGLVAECGANYFDPNRIERNHIANGSVSATGSSADLVLADNTLLSGGIDAPYIGGTVSILNNMVQSGSGLVVGEPGELEIRHNVVTDSDRGIWVSFCAGVIEDNTVTGCQGNGIDLGYHARCDILRNIISSCDVGVSISALGEPGEVRCNDVWNNVGGNWIGIEDLEGMNGNFAADPRFCDADAGDYTLRSDSPCLPENHPDGWDCGLIGALDQGCDPPIAACCLLSYCAMMMEAECVGYGGSYQGDGSDCDPNPCGTSGIPDSFSVEETTWGRLKALYR